MLKALLHGKLSREQENMEDILTSMVFGTMAYLPAETLAIPLLRGARDVGGERIPEGWLDAAEPRFEFWPWVEEQDCNGCEPDVAIRLDGGRQGALLLVEAKYRSGKSSGEDDNERPNDQLAREWSNLEKQAAREGRQAALVYVTAHVTIPVEEIEESQAELARKRRTPGRIYWLSWRHVVGVIRNRANPILEDLDRCLRRMSLTFFEGLGPVKLPAPLEWSFRTGIPAFNWSITSVVSSWVFSGNQPGDREMR